MFIVTFHAGFDGLLFVSIVGGGIREFKSLQISIT